MKISESIKNLKVGDRIRSNSLGSNSWKTYSGTICCIHPEAARLCIRRDDGSTGGGCLNSWEVLFTSEGFIENLNTSLTPDNMSLTEKFALAFKKEPQKSFRKAGITNGDDILTDEGQKIFLTWLLSQHEDAFKKEVVDPILEEEKAK